MTVSQWFSQLNFDNVITVLISALASIVCLVFHECSHGLVALWLGDDTAKRMGRLTLNPLKHVDIVGLIMMAVAHVGWAKAVPVDMRKFKYPKWGMALTALAGPMSNILLAFVLIVPAGILNVCAQVNGGAVLEFISRFFNYTVVISCGLAIFNLIPIPPLDGSKVLFSCLPKRAYYTLMRYESYGMFLLIALVMALSYFSVGNSLLDRGIYWLYDGIYRLQLPVIKLILQLIYPNILLG